MTNLFALLKGNVRTVRDVHRHWQRILRRDPCSYCGGKGGTIDHVLARNLRLGKRFTRAQRKAIRLEHLEQANDIHNLVGACVACNTWKADHSLLGFLLMRLANAHSVKQIRNAEIGIY